MCQDRSLRPDAIDEDDDEDWRSIAGWMMELGGNGLARKIG